MGISGLLPLLKSIQNPTHLRAYAGLTLGIDTYGWLHRGTFSCAQDLALNRPTQKYVDYIVSRIKMLQYYNVTPYLVFDGDYLPSKAATEAERAASRARAKERGLELLKMGRKTEAHSELQKAVDVTPAMAAEVIKRCEGLGVKCVVAPYEADAQLYYLEKIGEIQGVISEDSDMLVFGVKRLITKLDQYGECVEVCRDAFAGCKEVTLAGWGDREFRLMCILSGCDYLDNIPGLGLKKAHKLVRQHKEVDKILRALQFDGNMKVPVGYADGFRRAESTFMYQRVFDPREGKLVHANEPEVELDDESLVYIGPDLDEDVARGVAEGRLCPMTKRVIELSTVPATGNMSRPRTFTPKVPPKDFAAPPKNKSITSFFKPQAPPSTPARTPLAPKPGNTPAPPRAASAPSKIALQTSAPQKRPLPFPTQSETKKPRPTPIDIEDDVPTVPQSEYFAVPKMRRVRPLPSPVQPQLGKENTPPTPNIPRPILEKSSPSKILVPSSPEHKASSPLPPITPAVSDPIASSPTPATPTPTPSQRVAQGWKEKYSLNYESSNSKLASIVKKTAAAPPRPRMTPLQRLGASASRKRTSPPTQGGDDFWPDFVGTAGRRRVLQPPIPASGDAQAGGLFGKFAYKR